MEASGYLQSLVDQRVIPGAVYLYWRQDDDCHTRAVGFMSREPGAKPMQIDALFDLASLTKPAVTATAILTLSDAGKLDIRKPVSDYLPVFRKSAYRDVSIQEFALHTSGLPAWLPVYSLCSNAQDVLAAIASMKPAYRQGSEVRYSCLGYIVLGKLVETISGQDLYGYARENIFEPCGMNDACFNPPFMLKAKIPPTEKGNAYEQQLCRDLGYEPLLREGLIHGEVHDTNAWFLGGISGNAGLFGSADDLRRFGMMLLNNGRGLSSRVLSENSVRLMMANLTTRLNEHRSLGWMLASTKGSSAGSRMSQSAFGHTGFTGTSLWIDPEKEIICVLLTNRIHPRVDANLDMTGIRARFHDMLLMELDQ